MKIVSIKLSDSVEHCAPARSHNRKSPNWRPNEDIALCQSWVRCSENLIIGTSVAGYSLWSRIFEDFCEHVPGTLRTKKSLENRWTLIQDDVTKWKTIVNKVHKDRSVSGGTYTSDEWGVCYKAFTDDHTRAFRFHRCWEILNHSEKWNDASSKKCEANLDSRSDAVNTPLPLAYLMHDSSGSMDLSHPSSESSYSQTNILASSIASDPLNVVTKLESNSAEHSSVPARPPNRKALNWRPNEDIALCQAWVRCSENLISGTSAYSLWNRIFEDFCDQLPGTTRTRKSLENRWTGLQDDVTNWNTIVNRVLKDLSAGTTIAAEEWGVCYKAFRDDHGRDFKFYHCWEVLHHSAKWNTDKPCSGSNPVNASRPPAPVPGPPASSPPLHDFAADQYLDGLHDSSSMPSADNNDDPSFLSSIPPSEALESPSGSESVREKRRRIEEAVHDNRLMDQFFECIKTQQLQIQMLQQNQSQMMQELSMTQFGDMKPVNECHSFHLVKKIKLEQLKLSIDIIQAIGDTEAKMISSAPHLMSDEVSVGRVARFKKLRDLERNLDEIWQLEYTPGGNAS